MGKHRMDVKNLSTDILSNLGLEGLKSQLDAYILKNAPEVIQNIITAGIILIVGQWIARVVNRVAETAMARARLDETLAKFFRRIIIAVLYCAVSLAALDRLGVNTTSLTAVLAAAGLAVGMALQNSLSNFAAGVMIVMFRPFRLGDFVEIVGTKGIVEEIHIFSTFLRTTDNIQIVIPNGSIVAGNILNYSIKPSRRVDLVVSCGYRDDIRAVKKFLEELVRSDTRILQDPPAIVAVDQLADHAVNFVVRPWVPTEKYWEVRWSLLERIKLGFDELGFEIPFPQRDVHVYQMQEAKEGATGTGTAPYPRLSTPVEPVQRIPRRAA
jgi:small conductance mechanosensitive channel